jgi:hypothetical protein
MSDHWWFNNIYNSNNTKHIVRYMNSTVTIRFIDMFFCVLLISVVFFAFGIFAERFKRSREINETFKLSNAFITANNFIDYLQHKEGYSVRNHEKLDHNDDHSPV